MARARREWIRDQLTMSMIMMMITRLTYCDGDGACGGHWLILMLLTSLWENAHGCPNLEQGLGALRRSRKRAVNERNLEFGERK